MKNYINYSYTYVFIIICSLSFLSFQVNNQKKQALSIEAIRTQIINDIKATKKVFDWKNADDQLIYSALIQTDSVVVVGYRENSNEIVQMKNIDIGDAKLIQAKKALQKKIIDSANSTGLDYKISYIIEKESPKRKLPYFYARIFNLDLIKTLRNDPRVRYVQPVRFKLSATQNDPTANAGCGPDSYVNPCDRIFVNESNDYFSWHLAHPAHRVNQAWEASQNKGSEIKVGIFDTGISEEFISDFNKGESGGRNITPINTFVINGEIQSEEFVDTCGHGTSIAGLIAGPKTNDGGVFGIAYKADLKPIKTLDDVIIGDANTGFGLLGDPEVEGVINGLNQAIVSNVRIINMSIGGSEIILSNTIDDALRMAYENGIIMFAAAGTFPELLDPVSNTFPVVYPASSEYTIGVTGIKEKNGATCSECGDGPEVDFVVFMERDDGGRTVTYGIGDSKDEDSGYSNSDSYLDRSFGGSSAATATMTGIAALLWGEHPSWTREQVISQLILSSSNYPYKNDQHGWGTVDVYEALTEKFANTGSVIKNRVIIENIQFGILPESNLDNWVIIINDQSINFKRTEGEVNGTPSMFIFDENNNKCNSFLFDFSTTNILNVKIWIENEQSQDCKYNEITDSNNPPEDEELDYDYYEGEFNMDDDNGAINVNFNSENSNLNYSFILNYRKYSNEQLSDLHQDKEIPEDYCIGSSILFYEQNDGVDFIYVASGLLDTEIDFNFNLISSDLNNEARSIRLRDVEEGQVFKFYDKKNIFVDENQQIEINGGDWTEVIVKKNISNRLIGTLEESFENDELKVIYHENNGLDGDVSFYKSVESPTGAVIDFYDNDFLGPLIGNLICSVEIKNGIVINFDINEECKNDDAESVILYDIPVGTIIKLYDDSNASEQDDMLTIFAKTDLKMFEINNLESSSENENIKITYDAVDGLNKKVSLMIVSNVLDSQNFNFQVSIENNGCVNGENQLTLITNNSPPEGYSIYWVKKSQDGNSDNDLLFAGPYATINEPGEYYSIVVYDTFLTFTNDITFPISLIDMSNAAVSDISEVAESDFIDCNFCSLEENIVPVISSTINEICPSNTEIEDFAILSADVNGINLTDAHYVWYQIDNTGNYNMVAFGTSISEFITTTVSTYVVRIESLNMSDCFSSYSNPITIDYTTDCFDDCTTLPSPPTLNPPISLITLDPNGCGSNNSVKITASNSPVPSGYNLQWYKNGSPIFGSPSQEDITASTLTVYNNAITNGIASYSARWIDPSGCYSNFSEVIFVELDDPCPIDNGGDGTSCDPEVTAPVLSLSGNITLCNFSTNNYDYEILQVTSTIPEGYDLYWYQNGALLPDVINENLLWLSSTSNELSGESNSTITALITDSNGCDYYSNSISLVLVDCFVSSPACNAPDPPFIEASEGTGLCAQEDGGPSVTILGQDNGSNYYLPDAPAGFYYQWTKDGNNIIGENLTSLPIVYTQTGTYAVYLTNGSVCSSPTSNTITITNNCNGEDMGACVEDPVITTANIIDEENGCLSFGLLFDENCCGVNENNLTVYQNGIEQTEYFEVIQPGQGGGVRLVDIVIAIDISGSMDDDINALQANIGSFLNTLDSQGDIDYAVGLITFIEGVNVFNLGNLYLPDPNQVPEYQPIVDAVNQIYSGDTNGPPLCDIRTDDENAFGGLFNSATMINYRPGAQSIVLLMTDEPPCTSEDESGLILNSLINEYLLPNGIIVYPIFRIGQGTAEYVAIADQTNPAGATQGETYFNINQNFDGIVNQIQSTLVNSYVVTYCSDEFDQTTETEIIFEIDCDGETYTDELVITPSECPAISLTSQTQNFINQGWPLNSTFNIQVSILDNVPPYPTSATLFYANTGGTYSSVAMSNISANIWEAEIPATVATDPGIDFYISTTDGVCSSSSPSVGAQENPYNIAILPNEPPSITHSPNYNPPVFNDYRVCANVSDVTNELISVNLYYRIIPSSSYINISMTDEGSGSYCGNIPYLEVGCEGIQYYIEAIDDFGITTNDGNLDNPITIYPVISNPPSGLTAAAISSNQILLSWQDNSGATQPVIIQQATTSTSAEPSNAAYSTLATVPAGTTSYTVTLNISANEIYWFQIQNEASCEIGNGASVSVVLDEICASLGCGCTDPYSCNYTIGAQINNGSCEYESCSNCSDPFACNYNPTAQIPDDSLCDYITCIGCTDMGACNWNPTATIPNPSACDYSCSEIEGCLDLTACNYNPNAAVNNNSCEYASCIEVPGCTDPKACNFNVEATTNDGTCNYEVCSGCTDPGACNFNPTVTTNNGSCDYETCAGCNDPTACNYQSGSTRNDGTCEYISCLSIIGCTNPLACNYNPFSTVDSSNCEYEICNQVFGCTDPAACNYLPEAEVFDNSCEYISCYGCTDLNACNYEVEATFNDGRCIYTCNGDTGCTNNAACNFNPNATSDDGSCEFTSCARVPGCSDPTACNFNENATTSNQSCNYTDCAGCADPNACNYDASVTINIGCDYTSCVPVYGCSDPTACNYLAAANVNAGCDYFTCNQVAGCTDPQSCNFNSNASQNDGSCEYISCAGCTDPQACNFNINSTINNSCEYNSCIETEGCTSPGACNYNPNAQTDDGNCEYESCKGCTDANACNFNPSAQINDLSCAYDTCLGCTDPNACNYNENALIGDGSCDYTACSGCIDPKACNFNENALVNDGTCEYTSCADCTDPQACNYNPDVLLSADNCNYTDCVGCTDPQACNFDINATIVDDSCNYTDCIGCTDPKACNYDVNASVSGTCNYTDCIGCTDLSACNYDANALINDGSCEYTSCTSCGDPDACNYNPFAQSVDNSLCDYTVCLGCTNPLACNFNANSTIDDGSCESVSCSGCTDPSACNFNADASYSDNSCEYTSCKGCTDPAACNYNEDALINDNSCEFESCEIISGCTNPQACNYNPQATANNGTCEYITCNATYGCTDSRACNFNSSASASDQTCEYTTCLGCTDSKACNYNPNSIISDNSCTYNCYGCTDPNACNFDATATIDDGSCFLGDCSNQQGCTNSASCNYNPQATIDNGSCENTSCGCTDPTACNYNANATIGDDSCNYTDCIGCTDPQACNYDEYALINNSSCEYESCIYPIEGCTDLDACNYNPAANVENNNCEYESCNPVYGCLDNAACNYNPNATISNYSCDYESCLGCTDPQACNYVPSSFINDGGCEYTSCRGCADPSACNYDENAQIGSLNLCIYDTCDGCTDSAACNYNPHAVVSDNSCDYFTCLGCTDSNACSFDAFAKIENGTCEYLSCVGCTDPNACNFDLNAGINDSSCEYTSCVGCTDISACNYEAEAIINDGSCEFETCQGCTDPNACNFNETATVSDNTCTYIECRGCLDPKACNFNSDATLSDESCIYLGCSGCTDPTACNFEATAIINDNSCEFNSCVGCTDIGSCNFDPNATINNNTCIYSGCGTPGCTDVGACNYNPSATENNNSCEYNSCIGCSDPLACNYNPVAQISTLTVCEYISCKGCSDPFACNFDPSATINDGTCDYSCALLAGCTNPEAINFNPSALIDDGSCECSTIMFFVDLDGDGLGDPNNMIEACSQPPGYVINNMDDDDTMISEDIPTLSQWSLILLALILLSITTISIIQNRPVLANNNGVSNSAAIIPYFDWDLFKRMLLKSIPIVLLIFMLISFIEDGWFIRNLVGTVLSAGIIVFLFHFIILSERFRKEE